MKNIFLVLCFICLLVAGCSAKTETTIFAAASLKDAVEDLVMEFNKLENSQIKLNFASSGQLAQQIVSGAPADIYLSADMDWINFLIEKKSTTASNSFPFCSNRLAIIAPSDSKLEKLDLNDPALKIDEVFSGRLVIGDAMHVPGGKYAQEFLKNHNLLEKLANRLLPCISIREALILIEIKEWELGIVFYSDCMASKKVKLLAEIPENEHSKILYGCSIINKNKITERFAKFLLSPVAKQCLKKHHFFPLN